MEGKGGRPLLRLALLLLEEEEGECERECDGEAPPAGVRAFAPAGVSSGEPAKGDAVAEASCMLAGCSLALGAAPRQSRPSRLQLLLDALRSAFEGSGC